MPTHCSPAHVKQACMPQLHLSLSPSLSNPRSSSLYPSIILVYPPSLLTLYWVWQTTFMMTDYTTYLRALEIPVCFCGFPAVVIQPPLQPSIRARSNATSVEEPFSQNENPDAHTSNWVYECHFSLQQQGMAPILPCPKCTLDARRARDETVSGAKLKVCFLSEQYFLCQSYEADECTRNAFRYLRYQGD